MAADSQSAHVTSRLQFWKYPDLMAQWPFAQEYEVTYSLADGVLEVKTTITNLSADPMPVIIGFHPFFQIPGIPRDEWTAHLSARLHVVADETKFRRVKCGHLTYPIHCLFAAKIWTTALPAWNAMRTAVPIFPSKRVA